MIINYTFSSYPQRSVTITATDGTRLLTLTEPITQTPSASWHKFEKSGYSNPEIHIPHWPLLHQKLLQSEQLLTSALQSIQRSSQAIDSGIGFIAYGRQLIADLKTNPANTSRIRKYSDSLSRFASHLRTLNLSDIPLAQLSTSHIDSFTAALLAAGRKPSTISFYCRILQAIYNTAIRAGLINPAAPFANAPTTAPH